LPVDIDTSVPDNSKTKKEGSGWTGNRVPGAALPEGEGEFIRGVLKQPEEIKAGKRYLFRLDSGNEAWDTQSCRTEEVKETAMRERCALRDG
jgi:hypothetical protein